MVEVNNTSVSQHDIITRWSVEENVHSICCFSCAVLEQRQSAVRSKFWDMIIEQEPGTLRIPYRKQTKTLLKEIIANTFSVKICMQNQLVIVDVYFGSE